MNSSAPNTIVPTKHDSSAQVWVDVGGTFTDCIVWNDGNRRAIKVLSSGRIRARIIEVISPNRVRLDWPSVHHFPAFWKGVTIRVTGDSNEQDALGKTTKVTNSFGPEIETDRPLSLESRNEIRIGDVVELNAELEAPVLATRLLLNCPISEPLPAVDVRLGTTRGTNALLTRTGARIAFVTTAGFGDLLSIGEQDRPDLFALNIQKFEPLAEQVIEVRQRTADDGTTLIPLDAGQLKQDLVAAKQHGIESLAICLMHAHVNGDHELSVARIAAEIGFTEISCSHEVAPLIKMVSRGQTTTLDAYLNPILKHYVARVASQFGIDRPQSTLRLMTSNGNLVRPESFRGRDSILSGPAGGGVALAKVAESIGASSAIGLDMGGTSTDVSRYAGSLGRRFESRVSGVRVMTPMMDIHTVAAGGGSICDFVDGRMVVGPQSAGSTPGPACYGRGGPATVTDMNLLLGRIAVDRFPIMLDRNASISRLAEIENKVNAKSDHDFDAKLANGFLQLAVTQMAEAVTTISSAEGVDVRQMTLVGFGGAAGQNLCQVAETLGIKRIADHPDAAMLSALGMGLASIGHIETQGVAIRWGTAASASKSAVTELDEAMHLVQSRAAASLRNELTGSDRQTEFRDSLSTLTGTESQTNTVDVRYVGTESSLQIAAKPTATIATRFAKNHQSVFGYVSPKRPIEIVAVRCELAVAPETPIEHPTPSLSTNRAPVAIRSQTLYSDGNWVSADVFDRPSLSRGSIIDGPALIVSDFSTLVVQPNWSASVRDDGTVVAEFNPVEPSVSHRADTTTSDDPFLVEIVARRLQGIADSMGEVLRRTATSVNVKERRDYSCAVFRSDGALMANAPHVPVHLGAMGHTVRHLIDTIDSMRDGDCYVTNDPMAGGSHLPDVTVVTPVFCNSDSAKSDKPPKPDFFVASRAHHAEIGGKTPGSMPPDGRSLADEGVLIRDFVVARQGVSREAELRQLLCSGEYPSRNPEENIADIRAQQAAGREGQVKLQRLADEYSVAGVNDMMQRLLDLAGHSIARLIASLPSEPMRFTDMLDDGTEIRVCIKKENRRLSIDFTGTNPVHQGCFNATPAIVTAAVLYVLRSISDSNLPLCDGVLRDVDVIIPTGLLSPPAHEDPKRCAAVVAGNVETSQRVVDVLLGALDAAAASQGTMNNLLIGDATFGYYETICGGAGATATATGADAVHTHMTNTRITDPEVLESRLPVRLLEFAIRRDSGGRGQKDGGCGVIRHFEFLRPLTVSLITNRRSTRPYGIAGGGPGESGINTLHQNGSTKILPPSVTIQVAPGDQLRLQTPGGGGWGPPNKTDQPHRK